MDIIRNGRKNPQYHIIGDRGREPFHLSPLFVGRFYFLNISVLLRIGDGVVVWDVSVSVP